jgi:hypothetical protein
MLKRQLNAQKPQSNPSPHHHIHWLAGDPMVGDSEIIRLQSLPTQPKSTVPLQDIRFQENVEVNLTSDTFAVITDRPKRIFSFIKLAS